MMKAPTEQAAAIKTASPTNSNDPPPSFNAATPRRRLLAAEAGHLKRDPVLNLVRAEVAAEIPLVSGVGGASASLNIGSPPHHDALPRAR
jgi:hypothetical protein